MKYIKSVIGGVIGAFAVLVIGFFIPFIALCILVAGLLGQIEVKN